MHPGHGFAGEVLRRDDHQVGGPAVRVVHEAHDVAVVLPDSGEDAAKTASPTAASLPNGCTCTVPAVRSCLNSALVNAPSSKFPFDRTVARLTSPTAAL